MRFYYAKGKDKFGELDVEKIAERIQMEPNARHLVWREGMKDWKDASEVPEIAALVEQGKKTITPLGTITAVSENEKEGYGKDESTMEARESHEMRDTKSKQSKMNKTSLFISGIIVLAFVCVIVLYFLVNEHGDDISQTTAAEETIDTTAVNTLVNKWNDGLCRLDPYAVASCYQHKNTTVTAHAANLGKVFQKWGSASVEVIETKVIPQNPYKAEILMRRIITYENPVMIDETNEHQWIKFKKYANERLITEKIGPEWLITSERPTNEKTSNLYYYDYNTESWWKKVAKDEYIDIGTIPIDPWK